MALSKEFSRPAETRPGFFPSNPGSSERKVNILPTKEAGAEARIREVSQMLFAERKRGEEGDQPQEKPPRTDGFEPFINPEPTDGSRFVNGYGGNFATKMEFNRDAVERVLEIAHLDRQVFLTSLSFSRQRSIERVNPDGSVTAKKDLTVIKKTQKDEEENPYRRVVSIPEGWRIEVNDGKIMGDLEEKKLTGEKLQTEFIQQFNRQLKQGVFECILKEKVEHWSTKVSVDIFSWVAVALPTSFLYLTFSPTRVGQILIYIFLLDIPLGFLLRPKFIDFLMMSNDFRWMNRKTDNLLEYFMPHVEIDKVARSWTFLSLKGRKLVQETKSETK